MDRDCARLLTEAQRALRDHVPMPSTRLVDLKRCIDRERGAVRQPLVEAWLSALDPDAAVESAAGLVEHGGPFDWEAILDVAATLGPPLATRLEPLARVSDVERRRAVYAILAEAGGVGSLPLLAHGLADSDVSVRWLASQALPRFGLEAVEAVLETLVRETATIPFHRAAKRTLRAIPLPLSQRAQRDRLVESLSMGTTDVESPVVASEWLDTIRAGRRTARPGQAPGESPSRATGPR